MTEYPEIPGVRRAEGPKGNAAVVEKLREWADKIEKLPFDISGFAFVGVRTSAAVEVLITDATLPDLEFYKYVYQKLLEGSRAPQGFIGTGGY